MTGTGLAQALARAQECLARRDLAGAEQAIAAAARQGHAAHPSVRGATGVIRLRQGKLADAVALLEQAHATAPDDPALALNLGRALSGLGRNKEAEAVMREALALQRDWAEAEFELAMLLHRTGRLAEAETLFRAVLRAMPELAHAGLALGAVLTDDDRPAEAEAILRQALNQAADPGLKSQIHLQLAAALLRERKDAEALTAADAAAALRPSSQPAALRRAEALQNLGRPAEALPVLRDLLARQPEDPGLHHDYNDLLYRLGEAGEFLKSYDRAPATRPLLLGKAHFLNHAGRYEEAHRTYTALLDRDPNDLTAGIGAARALGQLKRLAEAGAAFDALLRRADAPPGLFAQAAEVALLANDPAKAARLCETGLAQAPANGACLATLSTAWRMLEDGRDEYLSGYDSLIRVFDLEPPEGFTTMADFNAELNAALDRLHPESREFLGQSLRGGTQTPETLFGAGIPLVEKLKARIDQTVARYNAELPQDPHHPFLARRAKDFRYAASWSSRLKDRGFHVNHIHPMGWISSCYYVAVPPAAASQSTRHGWIKFGEPHLDVALKNPIRRAIQPAAGRLILFPSYLWHGTIPFRDAAARTTIAFDIVPGE